jgi:membrane protein
LLCVLAIASYFPLSDFSNQLVHSVQSFAPGEVISILQQQIGNIANSKHGGLGIIGFLAALWSSSSAIVAVIGAMNRAYDIEEGRSWWRVRVTAILLTIALSVFIVVAFTLVVVGPQLAELLGNHLGLGAVVVWTWKIVQWPVAFLLVAVGIGLVYYFAPDAEQVWVWITPGSLLATVLWLLGSLGFRFYVVNFGSYEATYGAVGGVIILLLWFYLTGITIMLGAETNAVIEHASPWAKAPGEKVPGVRKKIGAAAARAFQGPAASPREARPAAAAHAPSSGPSWLGVSALLLLVARWRNRIRG